MPADSTLIVAGEERLEKNLFQSLAERSKHEDFLRRAVDLLVERVVFGRSSRTSKVVEWAVPEEIKSAIDLTPRESPLSHDELLKVIADVSIFICCLLGIVWYLTMISSAVKCPCRQGCVYMVFFFKDNSLFGSAIRLRSNSIKYVQCKGCVNGLSKVIHFSE